MIKLAPFILFENRPIFIFIKIIMWPSFLLDSRGIFAPTNSWHNLVHNKRLNCVRRAAQTTNEVILSANHRAWASAHRGKWGQLTLLEKWMKSKAKICKITVFTARCYASAVLAMGLCLCLCLSQVGVLLKWLNVGSLKQHHTIPQGR